MIKAIISDFSRVILFPKDTNYLGGLNNLHKELSQKPDYKALDHFNLNIELLDFYKSLQDKTLFHIFTTDSIQDSHEFQQYLQPIFSKVLSAKKMNVDKKDPGSYKSVATQLKLKPNEILYIDDTPDNVQAARAAGFNTVIYTDNTTLFRSVKEILGL